MGKILVVHDSRSVSSNLFGIRTFSPVKDLPVKSLISWNSNVQRQRELFYSYDSNALSVSFLMN